MYTVAHKEARIAYWTCGALSLLILLARLTGHFCQHRRRKCDATTMIVLASIGMLIARTVLNEVALARGTATILLASGQSLDQVNKNSSRIRLGTIFTLVARVVVTTYYWLQTVLLLLFYKATLDHVPWSHRLIQAAWPTIVLTWIGVVLATFLECRPFSWYWEVSPQGEHACTRAYIQLQLQAACNILLDILLLVLSFPIARAQYRFWPKNLQLGCLYVLGFLCMISTCIRVVFIYRDGGVQYARSFWASISILVATAVANGPSVYGACKVMRRRRESDLSLEILRSTSLPGEECANWRDAGVPDNATGPRSDVQMREAG